MLKPPSRIGTDHNRAFLASTPPTRVPVTVMGTNLAEHAERLVHAGWDTEAISYADRAIRKVDRDEPGQHAEYWRLTAAKAEALLSQCRYDEAIGLCTEIASALETDSDIELRMLAALALHHQSIALDGLGLQRDARRVHDAMVRRLGPEALLAFDGIITRTVYAVDPRGRLALANAMYAKGWLLGEFGDLDESFIVLQDLVTRFEGDEAPNLRMCVAVARDACDAMVANANANAPARRRRGAGWPRLQK